MASQIRISALENEVIWSAAITVVSQRMVSLLSGARSDYKYQTKSMQSVRIEGFCISDGLSLAAGIQKCIFSSGLAVLVLYFQMLWSILYPFAACSKSNKYLELEVDQVP